MATDDPAQWRIPFVLVAELLTASSCQSSWCKFRITIVLMKQRITSKLLGSIDTRADEEVSVRMPSAEHTLQKAYCATLNRVSQDVLREFALMEINGATLLLPSCALIDARVWHRARSQS